MDDDLPRECHLGVKNHKVKSQSLTRRNTPALEINTNIFPHQCTNTTATQSDYWKIVLSKSGETGLFLKRFIAPPTCGLYIPNQGIRLAQWDISRSDISHFEAEASRTNAQFAIKVLNTTDFCMLIFLFCYWVHLLVLTGFFFFLVFLRG